MILTVELAQYPLQEDYIPVIDATIEKLTSFDSVEVKVLPTATLVVGEYADVITAVSETLKWSYETYGKSAFVAKFLPGYDAELPSKYR